MTPARPLFTFLLPVAWVTLSALSFRYPGDEYNLWGFSSIAGTWIIWFARELLSGQHPRDFLPWILAAGFLTMTLLGYLLDRLRAPRLPFLLTWLATTPLLVINALSQYESYARAMSKNGSLQAYLFAASVITLTGTGLLFLPIAAGLALWRRLRTPSTGNTLSPT